MSRTWFLRVEIAAAAIAIAGLLLIHAYRPVVGFAWNVMHGEIFVTSLCQPPQPTVNGVIDFSDIVEAGRPWWDRCGHSVPYRFVLLTAVLIAAGGFAARRYS